MMSRWDGRDFFSILGKGPFDLGILLTFSKNWENFSKDLFNNFLEAVPWTTCNLLILLYFVLFWIKLKEKMKIYWKPLKLIFWLGMFCSNWEKFRLISINGPWGTLKNPWMVSVMKTILERLFLRSVKPLNGCHPAWSDKKNNSTNQIQK